ncbi:hypothetical protein [Williamwhitmania taraxaci]|uniref:Uncharacterized protein n=1 Tax=Williamwhitmania taraxaci TaxID=1640674 RepID=A0A1G6HLJ5_9BACT|nr:hypothetical protein [Williamwhitmania taraxaci]SDB94326.1 hypothetical protein SAMN05216323_101158 [Williamwhitmania taraxaci]
MEKKEKKRVITNVKSLPTELLELVKAKYPLGYWDYIKKFEKPNGDFFYYFTLDNEDASYLVKVDVKIDTKIKEDDEKDYFEDHDDSVPDEGSDDDPAEETPSDDYDD